MVQCEVILTPKTYSQLPRMTLHTYAPEWSYEETKDKLLEVQDDHFKQFFVLSYVVGARINEARMIQTKDIELKRNSLGQKRLMITVPTLKNRHMEKRTVPLNPFEEVEYSAVIKQFFKQNKGVEFPFHKYSKRWYQFKCKEILQIHNHALRHLRVHHIDEASVPGFKSLTPRQYQDFFGWETIATSSKYQSRTRAKDLADNF